MDIDASRYQELSAPINSVHHGYAPPVVVMHLAALVGDSAVLSATSDRQSDDDSSTWRVAAVTGQGVAFVEAVQSGNPQWEGGSPHQERGTLETSTGWFRPLGTIRSIDLRQVQMQHNFNSSVTSAKLWSGVTFLDGLELALPLFGTAADSHEHDSAAAVADTLRTLLPEADTATVLR